MNMEPARFTLPFRRIGACALPSDKMEILTGSEEETHAWARSWAASLKAGDVVALSGDLGSGKTVVCRGIAVGLGFAGEVNSPSYALVHEYRGGRLPVFHMDLYRLTPEADWEEIGIDHYFRQGGICLVEWPERLPQAYLSAIRLAIRTQGESSRLISLDTKPG